MRQWTIGKRLVAAFGVILGGLVMLGGFAALELRSLSADANRIATDAMPGTALSGEVLALITDNHRLIIEHVHATPAEMTRIESEMAKTSEEVTRLLADYEKTITQPDDRQNFDALRPVRDAFLKARTHITELDRARRTKEAEQALAQEVGPANAAYVAAVRTISDWNLKAGTEVAATTQHDASIAVATVSAGMTLLITLAVAIGFLLVRSTNTVLRASVDTLRRGAEQVVSASAQVASSAQALSQGATEQAASLEETSASMEEMASMTSSNADNADQGLTAVGESARQVERANGFLSEMVASMTAIKESSDKVARIIKTIDEIAFQTNILALNAAVEAARAGEAGMGFAVVADEVRNLAQRSAKAAKDTAGLIEESINRAHEGNERVTRVAAAIAQMTQSSATVKGLIEGITAASRQQAQGIDQVRQAVSQMEKVTQTTAASAEESAAAAEELSAQAEATRQTVQAVAALVDGAATGRDRRVPAPATPRRAGAKIAAFPKTPSPVPFGRTAEEAIPLESDGTYGRF